MMSSDITPRSRDDGTALVHSSRNTFQDTVTLNISDISTLKLESASGIVRRGPANDDRETTTSTLENTEELAIFKNQLSRRLKELQRQRNPNLLDSTISKSQTSLTSRQEMAETVELHHEYGITPSDLQGYFQQMIQQ